MDKNTIIGFILIAALLIGYSIYTAPSEAEIEKYKRKQDSLRVLNENNTEKQTIRESANVDLVEHLADSQEVQNDSLKSAQLNSTFGRFSDAAQGEMTYYTVENDYLKLLFSNKGGCIVSVELKEYKDFNGNPLQLFDEDSSKFALNFYDQNKYISTENFYFQTDISTQVNINSATSISFKLYTNQSSNEYIEQIYSIQPESYTVDYKVNFVGLSDIVQSNSGDIGFHWSMKGLQKEKNLDNERNTSTIFYKYLDDDVDYLSESSDDKENFEAKMQWVSFKQQFFSTAIIYEEGIEKSSADISVKTLTGTKYNKYFETNFMLPLARGTTASEEMTLYFGPNHYQTLKDFGVSLENQINLGWGIFGWVNKWMIIPIFNFLDNFNLNYGIIILLLTIFIKIIISPITYKNYVSSAKMKVLKPEIEELNEKLKNADALKKQQAQAALYKQAGVNPLAGCIPMLLQMPILYAMFRFFPASIELRQQGFLWADDLSSYDSILELGFNIPFYGSHVSLFTILMAISMYLYTKTNTQMTTMSGPQAAQMKMLTYMMPVMMLFFFNSFSSGLSYYYFLSNVFSMLQQWVIKKWFIDEDAIHKKIQENKKKPVKKSAFTERLEKMARERQNLPNKK
jgi:YidC/Oxa1 family membrane protein insertase